MTKTEEALSDLAKKVICEVLHEGKKKHRPDAFATVHPDYHLDRAMRHISTSKLIRNKHQDKDVEGERGHLGRALVRIVMAIHQTELAAIHNS